MSQTFIIIAMKRFSEDIRLPILLLALLVQAALLVRLDWTTSPNRTELGHMAASLRLYETQEYDLFHVNPPGLRFLVGPIVANTVTPITDWSDYSPYPLKRSEWATGVSFVKANDLDTTKHAFFVGRIACIPLILLGGWFGFRFARELFGEPSGFVFLGLWIFSPLILGWGATICPDVASASLGIVALYTFWHWIKKPTWLMAFFSGLTLGLLPLTKLTWVIAFGLWPLIGFAAFFCRARETENTRQNKVRSVGQMILILLLAVFVINLGYRFDGSFTKLDDYDFHSRSLTNENGVNRFSGTVLGSIPVPFPKHFVLGFDTQKVDFEQGIPSYLLGEHANHGWSYYYLVALAVKEPIGYLLLVFLAFALFFFAKYRSTWRDELVLATPMLTLFLVVSSQVGFSLHARYIIPFLPLFYIWISRTGKLIAAKNRPVRFLVPIFLLCGMVSSLSVYPHSMSYFNEAVGGPSQGHRYLLGSNVDWGQDLHELKDWLDEHPEAKPIYVAMSNIFPLEAIGIKSAGLPPKWKLDQETTGPWLKQIHVGPRPGWYLLGTNDLYGPSGDYDWLHELMPIKRAGYSVYLFHVTLEDANRLRNKYDLPILIEEDLK